MSASVAWAWRRLPTVGRWSWRLVRLSCRLAVRYLAVCGVMLWAGARFSQPDETYALDTLWTQIWVNAIPLWLMVEAAFVFGGAVHERRLRTDA